MKKIYEKPVLVKVKLNTEEIAASSQLSSTYTILNADSSSKTWRTVKY